MYLNENYQRALKGYVTNTMRDFRKMFLVVLGIFASMPFIAAAIMVIYKKVNGSGIMDDSVGILSSGFFTAIVVLGIAIFVTISGGERSKAFSWPINRKVYALGNSLVILLSSLVFLSGFSVILLLELIPAKILPLIYPDIVFTNYLTFENFLVGFWVSLIYLVLSVSAVYCGGMFFYRYKLQTAIVVGILAVVNFFSVFRSFYYHFFSFILGEDSVVLFSIKALAAIILLNVIGYLAIRKVEVKV